MHPEMEEGCDGGGAPSSAKCNSEKPREMFVIGIVGPSTPSVCSRERAPFLLEWRALLRCAPAFYFVRNAIRFLPDDSRRYSAIAKSDFADSLSAGEFLSLVKPATNAAGSLNNSLSGASGNLNLLIPQKDYETIT